MDAKELIKQVLPNRENLMGLLHELQDSNPENYLPNEVLIDVAKHFNLPLSSVYGLVGYYSMFSRKPRGKYIVRICNSPVCYINGSESVLNWAKEILGVKIGETTADRLFTIEESECLGRCGKGPSMMINKSFYGELTKDKLIMIFEEMRLKSNPTHQL